MTYSRGNVTSSGDNELTWSATVTSFPSLRKQADRSISELIAFYEIIEEFESYADAPAFNGWLEKHGQFMGREEKEEPRTLH